MWNQVAVAFRSIFFFFAEETVNEKDLSRRRKTKRMIQVGPDPNPI